MKNEKKQESTSPKSPTITMGTVLIEAQFRNIKSNYTHTPGLYIGKILVASFYYDGTRTHGDSLKYKVSSTLPSIKRELGHFETTKECE